MNRRTLRLYWQEARKHKVSFVIMLLAIPVGAMLIDTVLPYFLSQAISQLATQQLDDIQTYLVLGAIAGIGGGILNFVGFRAMVLHESNVLAGLREETFRTILGKDHSFFVNQKIGAMTSRYIDFVRSHITIQDLFIIRTLSFILTVGSGIVILAFQSWLVALLVALLVAALAWQIRWSALKRKPWRQERRALVSEIHGNVADALTNNLIVRTFTGESRELSVVQKQTQRFREIYKKDIGFTVAEGSLRVMLMIIVQIIAISISVTLVSRGELELGTAIFILAYLQRIGSQLFVLGDIINGFDQAFLDASPMTEMLLEPNSVHDALDAKKLVVAKPAITFEKVAFAYSDAAHSVLKNIDLNIQPGEKIGIVGRSGAGKTTFTHLLLRFSDVTAGAIKIDGHDIRAVTQDSLRQHIAYVPQEPMLFHRTIRENVAYGLPSATTAQIETAIQKANAAEFIAELPEGIDTKVGERGVKLSGGQRQRIAIARAFIKDAPILVLDEATSALDSESEQLIQASLWELMQHRTAIVIAHRLSTIQKMDRIIVMNNGEIAEQGSHDDLIRHKGIYSKLWAHQSGGFIEE